MPRDGLFGTPISHRIRSGEDFLTERYVTVIVGIGLAVFALLCATGCGTNGKRSDSQPSEEARSKSRATKQPVKNSTEARSHQEPLAPTSKPKLPDKQVSSAQPATNEEKIRRKIANDLSAARRDAESYCNDNGKKVGFFGKRLDPEINAFPFDCVDPDQTGPVSLGESPMHYVKIHPHYRSC